MMTEGMGVGIDGSELVGVGEVTTAEATQLGLGMEGKAGGLSRVASGVRSPGCKGGGERKQTRLSRRLACGCKSNLAFVLCLALMTCMKRVYEYSSNFESFSSYVTVITAALKRPSLMFSVCRD